MSRLQRGVFSIFYILHFTFYILGPLGNLLEGLTGRISDEHFEQEVLAAGRAHNDNIYYDSGPGVYRGLY